MNEKHFLAITTVNGSCTVAVSEDGNILTKKTVVINKGFSEIIMPLIADILKKSRVKIEELNGFLACTGPGNYTSLRVAIATTRGLSLASGKPACGISLFELLATNEKRLLILIKGPLEKLYVQNFSKKIQISSPKLLTLQEIAKSEEYYGSKIIGYRAKEIGKLLNSKSYRESLTISLKNFVTIGERKIKEKCPRPIPVYIK